MLLPAARQATSEHRERERQHCCCKRLRTSRPPPNSPRNEGQDQCRPPPLHMPGKRLRRKQCGMCVKHFLAIILNKTVWPSGLRRWLQAPVRKGVGSNPTAVKFRINAFLSVLALSPTLQMPARRAGQAVNPMSVHTRGARDRAMQLKLLPDGHMV